MLALTWCLLAILGFIARDVCAQTVASKAKESGCVDAPRIVQGSLFRCSTASGIPAYFNVIGADNPPPRSGGSSSKALPTPGDFPRVDPGTQKGRDDVRRKVLADELATEEQLLAEARVTYANGAPVPLPEEQANAEKYRERIGRYRQAILLHERNIDALKKELGTAK